MNKKIRLPIYLMKGIKPINNRFPLNLNLLVFDVETDKGLPYFLIMFNGEKPTYKKVDKDTIFREFINYLLENCSSKKRNVLFAHNLAFDLTAVLSNIENEYFKYRCPPKLKISDKETKKCLARITKISTQKIWWANLKLCNGACVKLIDTTAFYRGALYNLSRELELEHKKASRPYFVTEGRKPNNKYEWKRLKLYCGREIKTTYDLALYIINHLWRKYNINVTVSAPHFASKVLRRDFTRGETIPQVPTVHYTYVEKGKEWCPENEVYSPHKASLHKCTKEGLEPCWRLFGSRKKGEQNMLKGMILRQMPKFKDSPRYLAEKSLHGGRGETFISTPITLPNVAMYDINSSYPYSMTKLPNIMSGEWKYVTQFDSKHVLGFYKISGIVKRCKYPIILKGNSGMEYVKEGKVENVYITAPELKSALEYDEIELSKCIGYVWIPSKDRNNFNPFGDYARYFYQIKKGLKREKGNSSQYETVKLLLNSLFGKTAQAVRETDFEEKPETKGKNKIVKTRIEYRAGGLYLPHIASFITGYARADLHDYLHKYNAIDCATDSFKTLNQDIPESNKLGELKKQYEGFLLLVRPRLYVMFSKRIQKEIEKVGNLRDWLKTVDITKLRYDNKIKNREIVHYATHGFWGNVQDLLKLYRDKHNEYEVKHILGIKEAIRQKKQARNMIMKKLRLGINWNNERGFCGAKLSECEHSNNCFKCPIFRLCRRELK